MENGHEIHICATVESVIYQNEETGYCVCDVSDENNELVTVVGIMPYISVGEKAELWGSWTHHQVYGRQFKVERCEKVLPTDKNDILRYLSSGTIKGIGPKIAQKIVDKYGEDSFDVISEHPDWLAEISGISRSKAKDMSNDFKEKSGIHEIMIYFKDKISASTAVKVYKKWGRNALGVIKENPYYLCANIKGMSFRRVDEMALQMGIKEDYIERIKGAIIYCLGVFASRDGHTYVNKEHLYDAVVKLIGIDVSKIEEAKESLSSENRIKTEKCGSETHIYLTENYDNEKYIAKKLLLLENHAVGIDYMNICSFISRIEMREGITYAPMQKKAIEQGLIGGITVLTGGPGTGKTTVIKALIRIFASLDKKYVLCAPTGRAAKRMSEATSEQAKTIHRLLEVSIPKDMLDEQVFVKNSDNLLEQDVIIVDEASMIDVSLMASLLKAIKPGAHLILIGDIYQLPSVGEGNVLHDIIKSELFGVVFLNEIFRQSQESGIVINAHEINNGRIPDFNTEYSDFFFVQKEDENQIAGYISNLCEKRIPKKYGKDAKNSVQIITPSKIGECGTKNLNSILQKSLNPEGNGKKEYVTQGGRVFRVGDKVMQTRNDYEIEWARGEELGMGVFNGDIGVIADIDDDKKSIFVIFDDKEAIYDFSMIDEIEHAYAITVHKSQGSEYPIVIIPLFQCAPILQTRNLIYTAITRAEKMVILVGKKEILEFMVQNDRQVYRNTGLCQFLRSVNEND